MQQVGYYRQPLDSPKTRRLNAICYHYYGMELVCFGLENVNINDKTIDGKVLVNGKWKKKTVQIPKLINNTPFKQRKYLDVINFLEQNSYMMFHRYGSKELTNARLKEDGTFRHLMIPTSKIETFADLLTKIKKHRRVILKPKSGNQGRGIYFIECNNDMFHVQFEAENKEMNHDELQSFYEKQIQDKRYIIQKYIHSRNSTNQPFDIRIQFEKNGKGKWTRAQTYVRMGHPQKIVSNIAKGGSIIRFNSFLKSEYGRDWKMYADQLKEVTKGLPRKIEQLYDAEIPSLGVDIGMADEEFYLFEVNYFPGGTFARGEVAMLRAAYSAHLLQTKFNEKPKHLSIDDYETLKQEKEYYERKYEQLAQQYKDIRQSTSWKLTKPLRTFGRIVKRVRKKR
ncbi:MAG TPA: YheC/YheD family protein [Bacillota bacterium]